VHVAYKGNNRILRKKKIEISEIFCEMLTSLEYKCVNKTNTLSPSPKGFQSPKFSDSDFREVRGLGRPKSSACNAH
jgi:hypothetical protein